MLLPFIKMNGAGNDFVIFDGRETTVSLDGDQVREIAARGNRHTKGCDQVIILEPSTKADLFMRIYNADGSEVASCGNATRCIASMLEVELKRLPVTIETKAGVLQGLQKAFTPDEEEYILVDMGPAMFDEKSIPLAVNRAEAVKKVTAFCNDAKLGAPDFISMGNPHVVFFVDNVANIDMERIGPGLEKYKEVFPEGVNVSVATVTSAKDGKGHLIHARVWERGAGFTKACGTAACAMLAAANRRDASVNNAHLWFEPEAHQVTVKMADSHVLLGGPVETEFESRIAL